MNEVCEDKETASSLNSAFSDLTLQNGDKIQQTEQSDLVLTVNVTPEQERDIIKALVDIPLEVELNYYLISMNWYTRWKDYVNFDNHLSWQTEKPGPIDNSSLISSEGKLRQ